MEDMQKKRTVDTLLKLSAAIGILSVALILFTRFADQDKLLASGAALAGLVATVIGAFAAVNNISNSIGQTSDSLLAISKEGVKLNKSTTPYIKMGIALLAFAGALAIISDAMTRLENWTTKASQRGSSECCP